MKRCFIWGLSFLFMPVWFAPAGAGAKGKIIIPGDFFPEFSFPMAHSWGDVGYLGLFTKFLGLMKGDTFPLKEIEGDLIVLEYMNKYCFSCLLQAPVMNQAFQVTGKAPSCGEGSNSSLWRLGTYRMKWIPSRPKNRSLSR